MTDQTCDTCQHQPTDIDEPLPMECLSCVDGDRWEERQDGLSPAKPRPTTTDAEPARCLLCDHRGTATCGPCVDGEKWVSLTTTPRREGPEPAVS